jgi:hypothetical protein
MYIVCMMHIWAYVSSVVYMCVCVCVCVCINIYMHTDIYKEKSKMANLGTRTFTINSCLYHFLLSANREC